MILDVGSGDINHPDHILLDKSNVVHFDVDPDAFCVEVNGSAEQLPFQNNSFDIVHISHVLEHLKLPLLALEECKRVSKRVVVAKVPNASRFFHRESLEHLHSWNQFSFKHFCDSTFSHVEVHLYERIARKSLVFRLKQWVHCALFRPIEIAAFCYKS